MTRAAIYARISDDRGGEGLGVARQVEDCQRLAEQRGWSVAGEYVDNDLSAYRGKKRPRYEAMLADIEAGEVDAVIAYHQDRLTRQPAEFETFLATCQRAGVRHFTTVTGYTDLGQDDGVMVMRIFSAVAKNESDSKRRRIRRKNDEKAAKGLPHVSGERPFGYDRDGVTVREDEAQVIRTVADRFLAGESLVSLAGWLQQEGVKTSTGTNDWRTPTLRGVLLSPRNAGLRVHRGEVVGPAVWPAILTDTQHAQLVAKLTDPARRTLRTATPLPAHRAAALRCLRRQDGLHPVHRPPPLRLQVRTRLRRLRQGLHRHRLPQRPDHRRGAAAAGHPRAGRRPRRAAVHRRRAPGPRCAGPRRRRAARRTRRRLRLEARHHARVADRVQADQGPARGRGEAPSPTDATPTPWPGWSARAPHSASSGTASP